MIGLKKGKLKANPQKKRFVYQRFSWHETGAENGLTVKYACQCSVEDKELRASAIGAVPYQTNLGEIECEGLGRIRKIFFARTSKEDNVLATSPIGLVTEMDGGTVYLESLKNSVLAKKWSFLPTVQAVSFYDEKRKGVLVLNDGVKSVYYNTAWKESSLGVTDATGPTCVCKNRLFFAAQRQRLYFGAPGQVEFDENNAECGTLFFPSSMGEIIDLVSDGLYVYVFFPFGLARVKAAGTAREFCTETLFYEGEQILQGSAGLCGGKLFFLAMDGVYTLFEKTAKRCELALPILPQGTGQVCNQGVCGPYYLVQYVDTQEETTTVAVHQSGTHAHYVDTLNGLSRADGKTLCERNGKVCIVTETAQGNHRGIAWVNFAKLDFGDTKRKAITAVRLEGEGEVDIWLSNGDQAVSKTLDLSNGAAEWRMCLRGKEFDLNLQFLDGARVRKLIFTVVKEG